MRARISGVKGIRAGLYYDAGNDNFENIAALEPGDLGEKLVDFVAYAGSERISTLPAKAQITVEKARKLLPIVGY